METPRIETTRYPVPLAGRVLTDTPWHMPVHVHKFHHQTIIVLEGTIRVAMAGQVHVGRPGAVLFYPQGIAHEEWGEPESEGRFRTLFIGWERRIVRMSVSHWPSRVLDHNGRLTWLAGWMHELMREQGPRRDDALRSLMRAMAFEHSRLTAGPSGPPEPIVAATRYLREHLRDPLRLDDLANAAGLSRFHFARLFRQATGLSPMHYLAQARIDAARHLLRMTALPQREIARQLGFGDEYQFSRTFRRLTGHAPGTERH